VAQSVKRSTLNFRSDLDLKVISSSPALGSTLGMEPTLKKKRKKRFNDVQSTLLKETG